jgi:hypothetical protein
VDELLERARRQSDDYAARLDADALTWDQRRQAAHAEAAQIVAAAHAEAVRIRAAAETAATAERAEALRETQLEVARLEAEIAQLIGRRKAIVAQLGELSALAGSSAADYGDGDPAQ